MIFTLSAPRARKHINPLSYLEPSEVPWEPEWSISLNFTKFNGKSTFHPQSDIFLLFSHFEYFPWKIHPSPPNVRPLHLGGKVIVVRRKGWWEWDPVGDRLGTGWGAL